MLGEADVRLEPLFGAFVEPTTDEASPKASEERKLRCFEETNLFVLCCFYSVPDVVFDIDVFIALLLVCYLLANQL